MRTEFTDLEASLSSILRDISNLNLMIYENLGDVEKVRNLSNEIGNSLATAFNLFSEVVKEVEESKIRSSNE